MTRGGNDKEWGLINEGVLWKLSSSSGRFLFMHLQSLSLQQFRNYQEQELTFHPRFNLIIGKNAQGKTNILEAIYFLSYLNSFRTSDRLDLLNIRSPLAHIVCRLNKDEVIHDIRLTIEPQKRTVRLNGKAPNLYRDYYGLVPILLFEPKDVYLFRETPSIRRKFINRALFLEHPPILKILRDYDKVLAQKNRLLKEIQFAPELLQVWNEQLVTLGAKIIRQRLEWIDKINDSITAVYHRLSLGDEEMRVTYTAPWTDEKLKSRDHSEERIHEVLKEALVKKGAEEYRRKESVVGPHRDDWAAWLSERSIGSLGSQGENRSGVIALKATQVDLFEKTHGFPPLFLLDDVASELDSKRTEALLHYLRNSGGQVFLTTTEPAEITPYFQGSGHSFMVEDGKAHMLD